MARRAPDKDFDRDEWLAQKQEKLRAAHDLLEQGVESFRDSDGYRAYLEFQAKHARTFSFKNTLLIYSQMSEATLVMGFRQWQQHGRSVKKGERGLMILVPSTYKKKRDEASSDGNGDDPEEIGVRFLTGYAFDVSQTDGDPVPEIIHELRGTSEEILELRQTITRVLGSDGYEVGKEHLVGRHYGYVSKETSRVVTKEGVDDLQAVKTLIHEKAHVAMHVRIPTDEIPKEQRELEAESVAFVVLNYYGLNTSEYTFPTSARGQTATRRRLRLLRIASTTPRPPSSTRWSRRGRHATH